MSFTRGSLRSLNRLLSRMIFSRAVVCAADEKKDLPPRQINVAPEYPMITVAEGDDVSVDIDVHNGGRKGEIIDISLTSVPKGWKAWIRTYSFKVGGVFVASDSRKSLTLKAEEKYSVPPQKGMLMKPSEEFESQIKG